MSTRVVHVKREPYDVYIGRPGVWGNTYSHRDGTDAIKVATREEAIEQYRADLWRQIESGELKLGDLAFLAGKTLGCWCAPQPCHGDVLARAAEWAADELQRRRAPRN